MNNISEFAIQVKLTEWMIKNYPGVIFNSDLGGIRFSIGLLQKINKLRYRDSEGNRFQFPDFTLPYESRGGWFSLSIELKKNKEAYLLKGGKLRNNKHLQGQKQCLLFLRKKGHLAEFGDLLEAKNIINWYMGLSITKNCRNKKYYPNSVLK